MTNPEQRERFDISKYKPGMAVCTELGIPVRLAATSPEVVVGKIGDYTTWDVWTPQGRYADKPSCNDLYFADSIPDWQQLLKALADECTETYAGPAYVAARAALNGEEKGL